MQGRAVLWAGLLLVLLGPGVARAERERGYMDGRFFPGTPRKDMATFIVRSTLSPTSAFTPTGTAVAVVVGDCTVTFAEVTGSGVTSVVVNTELPQPGAPGYPAFSKSWQLGTTATVSGTITVAIGYQDTGLTPEGEAALTLVRWDGAQWADATKSRDGTGNTITGEAASLGKFSIFSPWPVLPTLTGKLAYTSWLPDGFGGGSTMAYCPDPRERVELAPGSTQGKWYPDGLGLVYRTDEGIILNALDGTEPTLVPMRWAWDPCVSPDQTSLLFAQAATDESNGYDRDLWITGLDGSNPVCIGYTTGQERYPEWSPTGDWIAYRRLGSPLGPGGVWLIRPDGTDDHFLEVTGVAGYTGLYGFYIDTAGWSPDGTKLVITFGAYGDSGEVDGIGTVAAEGGEITPVFIDAPGYPCCPAAKNPRWSEDGTKVVFSSGHHLAPNQGWGSSIRYEPGVELWMANADGSGGLLRLTYNDVFDNCATWAIVPVTWSAEPTEPEVPGGSVTVTTDDAATTITFASVEQGGATMVTVYAVPPEAAPAPPQGFAFAGNYYDVRTTAQVAGTITATFTYQDSDIPPGEENNLRLLHYDKTLDEWVDITTSLDTVNNIITGECTSLSPFALIVPRARVQRFPDVPTTGYGTSGTDGFWAFWEIEACVGAGIVGGYPDGWYHPEIVVTRDQMAAFISRALAGGDSHVPTGPATPHFPDVEAGHWAYSYVEYAYANNIVSGYPEGDYRPDAEVDRGQMAAFVARAMVTPHGEAGLASYTPPATPSFPDVATDFWTFTHIEYLKGQGIVGGYPDGLYHPEITCTRDQMAVYITRAFGLTS